MEIRNLVTFLQVAERKNFTQTAEALNYSQSTVSTQIKQLEEEIGAPLFERIHNRVNLTEYGELLYSYAQQIINITEEIRAIQDVGPKSMPVVRFAMAPSVCSYMMGKVYMKFHQMNPNIALKIIDAPTDELIRLLHHNDADLIFLVDRHLYQKDFHILSEKKERMRFVAGKEFAFLAQKSISVEELIPYPLLLTESGVSYRQLFDEKLGEKHLEVSPIIEMSDTSLLLELVELGCGISFLPDYVTQKSFQEGKIVYLDVPNFEINVWRQLVCHKNKWISPAIRKVAEYCIEVSSNM